MEAGKKCLLLLLVDQLRRDDENGPEQIQNLLHAAQVDTAATRWNVSRASPNFQLEDRFACLDTTTAYVT